MTLSPLSRCIVPLVLALFLCRAAPLVAEETYSFELSEIEKKPWHVGGYAELRPELFITDRDAALYELEYYRDEPGATMTEYNARLQLEGWYEKGIGRVYAKTSTDYCYASETGGSGRTALFEGYASLKPSPAWEAEAGKKCLRWGKGYAWNPVNFFDHVKDPQDPDLALEGYVMATLDYIRSLGGALQTMAFTVAALPVYDQVNDDLGADRYVRTAAKLYLLLYDTDIDLIYAAGGNFTPRYGVDFSRNLTSNFELHGECAYIQRNEKKIMDPGGVFATRTEDTVSGLLGIRYLSAFDLTAILEYYRNGAGYDADDMRRYYDLVHDAHAHYEASGSDQRLIAARGAGRGGYGRANPLRDYVYLRLSQKDPFDILYFTPAATFILNLDDHSFSLTPELVYTGVTNLELRLRAGLIRGSGGTEYGEKPNDYRCELRAGYSF